MSDSFTNTIKPISYLHKLLHMYICILSDESKPFYQDIEMKADIDPTHATIISSEGAYQRKTDLKVMIHSILLTKIFVLIKKRI